MEKNIKLVDFGRRIKLARGQYTSQQELADKVGTSKSMISQYENGLIDPRLSIVQPLADALGVSFTWLATGKNVVDVGEEPVKAKKIQDYIRFIEHEEKEKEAQSNGK